jgi:hypothetical protein
VFSPQHYFSFKSSAAVREAFSKACPDKEVSNKTAIHRLQAIMYLSTLWSPSDKKSDTEQIFET